MAKDRVLIVYDNRTLGEELTPRVGLLRVDRTWWKENPVRHWCG
jgi:hypothetical protein